MDPQLLALRVDQLGTADEVPARNATSACRPCGTESCDLISAHSVLVYAGFSFAESFLYGDSAEEKSTRQPNQPAPADPSGYDLRKPTHRLRREPHVVPIGPQAIRGDS
jgi:hypothetical protein